MKCISCVVMSTQAQASRVQFTPHSTGWQMLHWHQLALKASVTHWKPTSQPELFISVAITIAHTFFFWTKRHLRTLLTLVDVPNGMLCSPMAFSWSWEGDTAEVSVVWGEGVGNESGISRIEKKVKWKCFKVCCVSWTWGCKRHKHVILWL